MKHNGNNRNSRRRRPGGLLPSKNTLGTTSSSPIASKARALSIPTTIQSDRSLILGTPQRVIDKTKNYRESVVTPSNSVQNAKFIKAPASLQKPVIQYSFRKEGTRSVHKNFTNNNDDDDEIEFSDDASNDIKIVKAKDFEYIDTENLPIDQYNGLDDQLSDYKFVKVPCHKIVLDKKKSTIRNLGNDLRLLIATDLSQLLFKCEGQDSDSDDNIMKIDVHDELKSVYASDESVIFLLNKSVRVLTTYADRITIYGSYPHIAKLKEVWKEIPGGKSNYKIYSRSSIDIDNMHKSNYNPTSAKDSGFGLKSLKSLNRKAVSRGTTISRPNKEDKEGTTTTTTASSKTIDVKLKELYTGPTPIKQSSGIASSPNAFYSQLRETPSRSLRSRTKTLLDSSPQAQEAITIDDGYYETRPRKPVKRFVFKPSLQFRFKDNSVMRIKNTDFGCLYGSRWINDNLIDFFVRYLVENPSNNRLFPRADDKQVKEPEDTSDIQVLSTFFFNKLKSSPSYYQNIKNWISKIPLFEKKYLILPINESLHWYCIIIHNLTALFPKKDQTNDDPKSDASIEIKEDLPYCTIYTLDSLAQSHEDLLEPIRAFIQGYARDTFGIEIKDEQVRLKVGRVAKQPNFNDCGVHVIFNVLKFIANEERIVKLWDKLFDLESKLTEKEARNKKSEPFILWNDESNQIFYRSERSKMREKLRWLLTELLKEQNIRGDVVNDEDDHDDEDDDDDVVYIEPEEYHALQKETPDSNTEDNSKEASDTNEANSESQPSGETSKKLEDLNGVATDDKDSQEERKEFDEEEQKKYIAELAKSLPTVENPLIKDTETNDTTDEITKENLKALENSDFEISHDIAKSIRSPTVSPSPSQDAIQSSQPVELVGVEVTSDSEELESPKDPLHDDLSQREEIEVDKGLHNRKSSKDSARKYESVDSDIESIESDSGSFKRVKIDTKHTE